MQRKKVTAYIIKIIKYCRENLKNLKNEEAFNVRGLDNSTLRKVVLPKLIWRAVNSIEIPATFLQKLTIQS